MAGVPLQIVRDWVPQFNEVGPEGLDRISMRDSFEVVRGYR
jgi:hypothetical protein